MKKSELEKKLKELEERNNMLLLFNAHITRLCLHHTGSFGKVKNPRDREIADMYLIFNTHSFVSYFGLIYFANHQPKLKENKEFLDKWNKHVSDILNPLYEKELVRINEKYNPKKESPSYVS